MNRTESSTAHIAMERAIDLAGVMSLRRGFPKDHVFDTQAKGAELLKRWRAYEITDVELDRGITTLCEELDRSAFELAVIQGDADTQVGIVTGAL